MLARPTVKHSCSTLITELSSSCHHSLLSVLFRLYAYNDALTTWPSPQPSQASSLRTASAMTRSSSLLPPPPPPTCP